MTKRIFALLAIGLLVLSPVALAQDDGGATEESTEVTVSVGVWDTSASDSPDVVSEYEPVGGGAEIELDISTQQGWGNLLFLGHVLDRDDQDWELDFDVSRAVRSHTSYLKMIHRLGHQPLEHFEAVTNHGRIIQNSDLAPNDEYQITYSLLEHRTEFQPVNQNGFTLGLNYGRQDRRGLKQATTVSHCDTCHVVSQSRPIDERTEDAGIDAQFVWGSGSLFKASYNHRELTEGVRSIELLFDDALQPELLIPIFDNRLSWDSAQGPQPVHQTPDITKDTTKLELLIPAKSGLAINASSVFAVTKNETTGLEADYTGTLVSIAHNFKSDWKLRWRGQMYTIDNDDVFVDIVEPASIAGPHVGRTYQDVYGFNPDYLRLSAVNRDVIESRLDVSKKLGKKSKLKLSWDYEVVDRETFEVAPGDTKTTENVLGVGWSARPKKGQRWSVAYRHGEVDNPFGALDAIFSTLVSESSSSPFAPNISQYFEFQDARIGDTTASPESWDELKVSYSYTLGNRSFSASYRYWDGDNTGGDLTDWSRTNQSFILTYWSAPALTWNWNLTYAYHDTEIMFPTAIPIFDG